MKVRGRIAKTYYENSGHQIAEIEISPEELIRQVREQGGRELLKELDKEFGLQETQEYCSCQHPNTMPSLGICDNCHKPLPLQVIYDKLPCDNCGKPLPKPNPDGLDYLREKPKPTWKKGECKNCRWQGMYCVEPECNYEPRPEPKIEELTYLTDKICPDGIIYGFKSQIVNKLNELIRAVNKIKEER